MFHLIYASAAARDFTAADLSDLLCHSRHANARRGVTGILLFVDGSFFQVLEGPEAEVDRIFSVIARDRRHRRATVIIREPVAKRAFGDWSMGFSAMSSTELSGIAGFTDVNGQHLPLDVIDTGRARKLLQAFAAGRWRLRLEAEVSAA